MENFNKLISFVLGLIVVVVLLVILTSRFNIRDRFLPLKGGTPTPTKMQTNGSTPTLKSTGSSTYHPYPTTGSMANIPNTGAPTYFIPLMFLLLGGGVFLLKKAER